MGLPITALLPPDQAQPQQTQNTQTPDDIWGQVPRLRDFLQFAALRDAVQPFVQAQQPSQVPNSPDMDPSVIGASLSGGDDTPGTMGHKGGLRHALGQMLVGFAKGAAEPYRMQEAAIEQTREHTRALKAETDFRQAQLQLLRNPIDKPAQEGKTVETADGVWQWNPSSERYDIRVGPSKNTVGKTPQEQLFGSLIAQGMTPEQAFTHIQQLTAKEQRPDSPEQQFIDEYQRTHQGASVADAIKAYATASQKPPVVNLNQRTARSDKSYQYNSGVLDKIGDPITQAVGRMGRLQETLHQATPQADSLVAPELLTVMAGGQGSGLRMNEAEISRIVNGRTNLESLKAALNKWQSDPSKGLSITPAQRAQINSLVQAVNSKLQAKQKILDDARNALLDTEDPTEHRRIVLSARQKLTAIDGGQTQPASFSGAPGTSGNDPFAQFGGRRRQ